MKMVRLFRSALVLSVCIAACSDNGTSNGPDDTDSGADGDTDADTDADSDTDTDTDSDTDTDTDSDADTDADTDADSDADTDTMIDAPLPFKGVANSPCDVRRALGVTWYYNWMRNEDDPCADGDGGAFVPMIWGHGNEQSTEEIRAAVTALVDNGHTHVLGFNEPDNPGQSHLSVDSALSLWPAFDVSGILVGSPATAANQNPGQAWFTGFMDGLFAQPALRTDFLAIHWYGWNEGSCDAAAASLEYYIQWVEAFPGNRPIWLTEWGCLNNSAPDEATVIAFYEGALEMFKRHPRIERYAWYPWSTNCGLADGDGNLTALGEVFAAAPAHR